MQSAARNLNETYEATPGSVADGRPGGADPLQPRERAGGRSGVPEPGSLRSPIRSRTWTVAFDVRRLIAHAGSVEDQGRAGSRASGAQRARRHAGLGRGVEGLD